MYSCSGLAGDTDAPPPIPGFAAMPLEQRRAGYQSLVLILRHSLELAWLRAALHLPQLKLICRASPTMPAAWAKPQMTKDYTVDAPLTHELTCLTT